MKAIMLSIRPKWVAKILNGEKTIEIRKLFPKDYVGWVYIYCTKDYKGYLTEYRSKEDNKHLYYSYDLGKYDGLNGKVVAKFWCDKVEEITPFEEYESPFGMAYKLTKDKIACCQKAQLTYDEYNHYLKGKNGYAINITKLEIFDKPKELSEFKRIRKAKAVECFMCSIYQNGYDCFKNKCSFSLTKAPQNYCFIESEE